MDNSLLETANSLYEAGDYENARQTYLDVISLARNVYKPGEEGYLYHMMGNCLIKMRRYDDAIANYQRALQDGGYDKRGALCVNLGTAQTALGNNEVAVNCFETALNDPNYKTRYKALAALGNVQLKLGNPTAAGTSYRKAALEPNNPDPAKSLVNLGVCFMALNRPSDAVESYITALKFESKDGSSNKTYANLGQAYVATGRMAEAVEAFENATRDGSYKLSRAAFIDYDRARASLEADEAVDSGLDNFNSPYGSPADATVILNSTGTGDASTEYLVIPPADDTGFFDVTEEELNKRGKEELKIIRKRRNIGPKIFLAFAILLLAAVIAAGFLYYKGYGWPLQEDVVTNMFKANANGESAAAYWATDDESVINAAMGQVAKTDDVTVDAVERTPSESTAYVTAVLPEGGEANYVISLGRDGISWKVTSITLDFASRDY